MIGSVFTPEKDRGKGYARHLMRLLHWVIGRRAFLAPETFPIEWGSPPERPSYLEEGHFSTLYSELGPQFYETTGPTLHAGGGWRVCEPISTMWAVEDAHNLLSSAGNSSLNWRWLDKHSIVDAFNADAHAMSRELIEEPASRPIVFTYLPTHGIGDFHVYRLQHFWRNMERKPMHWGICAEHADASAWDVSTFASWTLDFRPSIMNRLIITRMRSSEKHFQALLFQIVDFAKRHLVDEIEVWGLPLHLRSIAQQSMGRTFSRAEHLPSFKWYGPGRGELKDVYWAYNEK